MSKKRKRGVPADRLRDPIIHHGGRTYAVIDFYLSCRRSSGPHTIVALNADEAERVQQFRDAANAELFGAFLFRRLCKRLGLDPKELGDMPDDDGNGK